MKVWYITMAFPVPSETFATTEVVAMRRHGVEIAVHTLRPPRKDAQSMLAERGLADLPVSHGSIANQFKGFLFSFIHPVIFFELLLWIFRYTWKRPAHFFVSFLWIPRTVQLYRHVKQVRPDVVHLYWGHYPSLLGLLIRRHLHDIVLTTSLSAYDLTMEYGCSIALLRRAHMVRTWARANVPHIVRLGAPEANVSVFYQCLDLSLAKPQNDTQRIPGRIVSAGRLIPAKAMDKVLEAFRIIHNRLPETTLVIMGDGPEKERLERLAEEWHVDGAVQFLGHVSQRMLFDEFSKSQVFLFLSEHAAERLPNVVKEAMATGCVCVVSRTKGIDEVIEHGSTGCIVEGNTESAADYVIGLLQNLRHDIVDGAIAHIYQNFSCKAIVSAMINHWVALAE